MKLSKYLRQNSRMLLMVFMALLLVSFLIPQTIQGLGGGNRGLNAKLGKAYGRAVTTRDMERAQVDMQMLWRAGLAPAMSDESLLEYILQSQEAQQLGIHVGREEVKALLLSRGFGDDRLRDLQRVSRRSYDQIFDTIGQWWAVNLMVELQASAVLTSLPRQELAYRDGTQQAVAQISFVDDKAFLRLVPEPTNEQLQAFFDECKGRKTAHTADKLEFGYLLPDRAQVEYLTVDPQKIKDKISVQAVQVKRFFDDNPQRYSKPDPLAQPAPNGQIPRVPMTFEEARDFARKDYREARAVEMAQRQINDFYIEAHQPWATSSRGEDGFIIPPQDVVSFEDLKKRATVDVEYGKTDLLGAEQLAALPGIGSAGVQEGREVMTLAELALRAKGILTKDPNDGLPVLNVLEPAPVLISTKKDQTGREVPFQGFLFRVVRAAPSAPPESLEPIRAQVIEDWKLVQAHELARARAEALAVRARQVGLAKAVEEATDLKGILSASDQAASQPASATAAPATNYVQDLQPVTPMQLTRRFGLLKGASGPEVLPANIPDAVFALASTKTSEADPHRVTSVPVANEYRWVVAQLDEIKPLYDGQFEAQLAKAVLSSENRERQRFVAEWMAPQNVKERAGFAFEPGREPRGGPRR
jgi:hypothetical protein